MLRKFTPLLFATFISTLSLQAQLNVELLGHLEYGEQLSNITGWAGGGREYAIIGTEDGTSIVDVTDPTDPEEIHFVDGVNSIWREVRTWDNYAYVVTEGGGGLLCIDLSGLPASIDYNFSDGGIGLSSGHTVFCDENGIVHVFGGNLGGQGDYMFDANVDPMDPVYVGVVDEWYIHDGFVRGDTLWAGNIYEGQFSVWDISDKDSPQLMATQTTPYNFTHNTWLTDDGNYLFTTDEVTNATVAAYDVSDLGDIKELDQFRANPGTNSIPHNVMVVGDFLVTAYYKDGVVITDAHYPDNMIKTGWYDTSPMAGDGFSGCWGAWPYLPSGNIIAADMQEGLFVLGPTYTPACYLEGIVTDAVSGSPIFDVAVKLIVPDIETSTDIIGDYHTGLYESGTYDVEFSKPGYITQVIAGVALSNGVVTTLNVEMEQLPTFVVTGQVIDGASGEPIPFADVLFQNDLYSLYTTCDAAGNFSVPSLYDDNYTLYAGHWGNITGSMDVDVNPDNAFDITLEAGYYDDFIFENAWSTSGTAETGAWERGEPVGTESSGDDSNPGVDASDDFGTFAYVTGNGGGAAGDDDVDNGFTNLTSPSFDMTGYANPVLSLERWFYNGGGGGGAPNDTLRIFIENETESVLIEAINSSDDNLSEWYPFEFHFKDYIDLTASMTVRFRTADNSASGHLVEGGVDKFFIYDDATAAPETAFGSDMTSGCAPLTVHYDDMSVGATAWSWEFEGGTPATSTLQNPVVTYATPGTYDVSLTSSNAMGSDVSETTAYVTVELCNGIEDEQANNLIEVAPNPFASTTLLSIENLSSVAMIEVADVTGKLIQTIQLAAGENKIVFGDEYAPGIYFVTLKQDARITSIEKVIKAE